MVQCLLVIAISLAEFLQAKEQLPSPEAAGKQLPRDKRTHDSHGEIFLATLKILRPKLTRELQIVGGPNARTDYHINETPEWFYQYKGNMLLRVVDQGEFRDLPINEGEMFLLPPNVPHNPVRFADTVGVVLEQPRPPTAIDRLRWYCQNCRHQVHEASFHCVDLGTQIKAAVNKFKEDKEARICKNCGTLCDISPQKTGS